MNLLVVKYPLTETIEQLKDRFQLGDKYKLVADFLRRVIEPTKKELDAKNPYTFTYKMNKKGC